CLYMHEKEFCHDSLFPAVFRLLREPYNFSLSESERDASLSSSSERSSGFEPVSVSRDHSLESQLTKSDVALTVCISSSNVSEGGPVLSMVSCSSFPSCSLG